MTFFNAPRSAMMIAVLMSLAVITPRRSFAASTDDSAEESRRLAAAKTFRTEVAPFIKTYCFECHGDNKRKGGVSYHFAINRPEGGEFRKNWQLALTQLKAHEMPPEENKQPTDEERKKFGEWMALVKYLSPKDPGQFVIRRLTKAEFGNTLHDFLGVDPSVVAELPEDVAGAGYLNALSSMQTEQYLSIANAVLDHVLGPKDGPPTEAQKRLFGATPPPSADLREAAKSVARTLTHRAYRRPASADEIETLAKVFDLAQASKLSYTASLRLMLKAILVSPQFLFITPGKDYHPGKPIVALDDYQLASRLSYFLWESMPDDELLALAESGKLHEVAILRAQVKRMLADARARALFDGFGAQWLGIGGLETKTFDLAKLPQMTPAMRAAMRDEVRLFFESIVRENRSVVNLINSDYTYLNETLAALYGLQDRITGPQMRRVELADANRGGILGMPAILAMTSFPDRTSAVKRGVWVLEQVLGEHVPPAPPNVPTLEKQDQKKVASMTLRQRTELHRTNAVCANCHKILDPIGFGLENFDVIGRWRDKDDSGGPIDAAGELPGGKHFSTPKELKAIIAGRKEDVARNLAEKLLAYALCRQLEGYDETVVDGIMQNLARDDYRMQTLITEVVISYPFLNYRIEPLPVPKKEAGPEKKKDGAAKKDNPKKADGATKKTDGTAKKTDGEKKADGAQKKTDGPEGKADGSEKKTENSWLLLATTFN